MHTAEPQQTGARRRPRIAPRAPCRNEAATVAARRLDMVQPAFLGKQRSIAASPESGVVNASGPLACRTPNISGGRRDRRALVRRHRWRCTER